MKKLIYVILFLGTILHAKEVILTANLSYVNSSDKEVKNVYHRITLPSQTFYQRFVDIQVEGVKKHKIKYHKNGIDRYIKLYFDLPAKSKTHKKIHFVVDIKKQTLNLKEPLTFSSLKGISSYIKPSKRIESEAKQIQAIAYLINKSTTSNLEKIKLAYEFTARYIKYTDMDKKTSALSAIKSGIGDCTEYSFLFVSLLRALDIPARKTTYFSFKKVQQFSQPNHNEAEVYTDQYGWIPIYANLSHGKYINAFRFGNIADTLILYKQGRTWTHYRNTRNKVDKTFISHNIDWQVKVLKSD